MLLAHLPRRLRPASFPVRTCRAVSLNALGARLSTHAPVLDASSCSPPAREPLPAPRPTLRALLASHAKLSAAISGTIDSPDTPSAEPERHTIRAWVRSVRDHKKVVFLVVTDGSLPAGQPLLQAVARGEIATAVREARVDAGASVQLVGILTPSRGRTAQAGAMELQVSAIERIAPGNALANPLSSPEALVDTVRENAHFRFRRSRDAAVLRTRDRIDGAVADWFRNNDFVHVTAPVITSSDCEGAGEVFQVLSDADVREALGPLPERSRLEGSSSSPPDPATARQCAMAWFWSGNPAYLTVSSQLHLEALAQSLGRVWTETPSFRAERSATNRHLAEFRMIEAEMAFIDAGGDAALDAVMDVVQGVIRTAIQGSLLGADGQVRMEARTLFSMSTNTPADDVSTDTTHVPLRPSELTLEQVQSWADPVRWPRLSYTEAIDRLQEPFGAAAPQWGEGLGSEHERWLATVVGQGPLFITRYPALIKPFYMRSTDNPPVQGATVDAFDLLLPALGELAGGSLREERAEVLQAQIEAAGLAATEQQVAGGGKLGWYMDLRKSGSAPHGGFGIGVERLVSILTHTDNVRDCVPFPTAAGALRF